MKIRLTPVKNAVNSFLRMVNLKFDTLTQHDIELKRLCFLKDSGHFENPVFPIPKSFEFSKHEEILDEFEKYLERFKDFTEADKNDVGYTTKNNYFTTPDAEVLYTVIRKYNPKRIIEIGSGNSSLITRQAIIDGKIETYFISVDPHPRIGIDEVVDKSIKSRVEDLDVAFFSDLDAGDVLFIDSSHEIKTGNDVNCLFLKIIPKLPSGVIIHVHDIFLPYEYPEDWVMEKMWDFKEQYLLQSILYYSEKFEVLWPGYYLQRNTPILSNYFPKNTDKVAKSLWIRKK